MFQNCNHHCVCEDSKNNTYGCVIQVTDAQTLKYCEFQDKEVTASYICKTCFTLSGLSLFRNALTNAKYIFQKGYGKSLDRRQHEPE